LRPSQPISQPCRSSRRNGWQAEEHLLADSIQGEAKAAHQYLGSYAFALPKEPQHDVLSPDEVVPEGQGLAERQLEDLFGPGSKRGSTFWVMVTRSDDGDHPVSGVLETYPQGGKDLAAYPVGLADYSEKQMLAADPVVVKLPRLFPG
jgi:hypothetical protein